jgi:hypothetical protein
MIQMIEWLFLNANQISWMVLKFVGTQVCPLIAYYITWEFPTWVLSFKKCCIHASRPGQNRTPTYFLRFRWESCNLDPSSVFFGCIHTALRRKLRGRYQVVLQYPSLQIGPAIRQ